MIAAAFTAKLFVAILATQNAPPGLPVLGMPERIVLARPILLQAEADAPLADPPARAFLLYRAAGAWLDLDLAHAIQLYRQAFASAQKIESLQLRRELEHDLLSELLALSPSAVLDLLPQAQPETQDTLYRSVMISSLMRSDVSSATAAFEQACAAKFFSERSATYLLSALPASDSVGRTRIFNAALATYNAQPVARHRYWSASRLVARFWQDLPPESVLAAIDIILDRAAEKDKRNPIASGNISQGKNSLSYTSETDLELFAVGPALKRLAPARAAALLPQHPAVEEYLRRFPSGLPSFNPDDFRPGSERLVVSPSHPNPLGSPTFATEAGAHASALTALDMGLEFTIPLNLAEGLGVAGSTISNADPNSPEAALLNPDNTCPPDVPHILASLDTVPLTRRLPNLCGGPNGARCSYSEESPRAQLLNTVAERCTYYRNKPAALSALAAQLALLPKLTPDQRVKFLASAADLYLRLGEQRAAASTVRIGFELAATLFQMDRSEPKSLNTAPKAVWPPAEVYRRMVTLGANADLNQTRAAIEAIPDPDLRELERVMLARALLGVPIRNLITLYPNGSSMIRHTPGNYDNF